MSSNQHPDRDSLSAFLEESLSIDATQWIEHHLEGCDECRLKLEQEQAFLAELDSLKGVKPPVDFTAGVMARVAQQPIYHPGKEVPWRRFAGWGGLAAAAMLVIAVFVGWVLVAGGGEGVEIPTGASAVKTPVDMFVWVYSKVRDNVGGLAIVAQIGQTVFSFVSDAPLAVKLALMLVAVGLNYALVTMVLNYQRRQQPGQRPVE